MVLIFIALGAILAANRAISFSVFFFFRPYAAGFLGMKFSVYVPLFSFLRPRRGRDRGT